MFIEGLVVSVDYAPQFSQSLPIWRATLDHLIVVTTTRDALTRSLCAAHNVAFVTTDAFYDSGAYFNKAAGMMVGVPFLRWADWVLLIDADVVPPLDWRQKVLDVKPQPGTLYGAWRNDSEGKSLSHSRPRVPDHYQRYRLDMMCGFFHLFHVSDPRAPRAHLLDTRWQTAGWYDTEFEVRWDRHKERIPGLVLTHLGPIGHNWCGVGNARIVRRMQREPMKLHRVGVSSSRQDG